MAYLVNFSGTIKWADITDLYLVTQINLSGKRVTTVNDNSWKCKCEVSVLVDQPRSAYGIIFGFKLWSLIETDEINLDLRKLIYTELQKYNL